MFLELFLFAKKMKFLTKGGIHCISRSSRYFQHAHFIPIVGVGKRGEYQLVHGVLPRQHSFGTTLRFTDPVPADSRQWTPSVRNCVTR